MRERERERERESNRAHKGERERDKAFFKLIFYQFFPPCVIMLFLVYIEGEKERGWGSIGLLPFVSLLFFRVLMYIYKFSLIIILSCFVFSFD